ncbi:MAG: outer membrane protein assembly factor BamA [Thermodesulfobacteriota bacterium]|nr:outer membrane protein assembly factor BamA [Thermodesulfobacteriota bacterium]
MKVELLKRIIFVLICSVFVFSINAFAKEKLKVGIVPFTIHADRDMQNYGESILLMIAENLENNGAATVILKDLKPGALKKYKKLEDAGIKYGVDYLIKGSIFAAGGKISVDTEMIRILPSLSTPLSFFIEVKEIKNLLPGVKDLTKEMVGEIFHKRIISEITIAGNKRIESYAVLQVIDLKKGDLFNQKVLSENLKKVYAMGYFEDVRIESEKRDQGLELIFTVVEKPSVRKINFKGNHVYEVQELKDVLRTGTGAILNIFNINKDISRIKALYTEKNYHNCVVEYEIKKLDHNQADLVFKIDEGEKLKIEKIIIDGNKFVSDKKIKKIIKTDEKGFFSWITSSGELDENELLQDVFRVESFYKNMGFVDARVSEPGIEYGKESITVKFKIEEGLQYKIGMIEFKGDLLLTKEKLLKKITINQSEFYSRDSLRKDILSLTDIYADKGFANADVAPRITRDAEKKLIDITFIIEQGSPVYFERIIISGNTKTRDKVIRRQLRIYEQELYSKSGIQRSVKNLRRTDYFENVDVKRSKGSKENTVNVNINITEKATGAFSFGGGYSSQDALFGMISISERNLFGRGQVLSLNAEVSGFSTKYTISFTEPWLFDIPLSAGLDLYNWDTEYDYYDKDSKGGAVRFGYMIFDYTYLGLKYGYEDFEITNVQEEYTDVDAGRYVTSSVTTSLSYDSRNSALTPTKGEEHSISIEYAGGLLGGEIDFTKYIVETGWYYPLFWKFTGFLHAKAGYLHDQSDKDIEIDYERFYLGGINSVRGYDWQDINASDKGEIEIRGGEKMIQFNAELMFPLFEKAGLTGVVFYDTGDVYEDSEDIRLGDLYSSYGAGFRWQSPMGPIRIEYGIILDGHEYKSGDGRWEFSMGGAF